MCALKLGDWVPLFMKRNSKNTDQFAFSADSFSPLVFGVKKSGAVPFSLAPLSTPVLCLPFLPRPPALLLPRKTGHEPETKFKKPEGG